MSYVDRNLMAGEHIVYRTRLHWILFLGPLIATLFLVIGGIAVLPRPDYRPEGLILVGLGLLAGILLMSRFITYRASEFAVSNKRVIIKVGVFRQHSTEILLTKIEAIGVDQPLLGRLFGFGTITVGGTGGTEEVFEQINAPLTFRRNVHEQTGVSRS